MSSVPAHRRPARAALLVAALSTGLAALAVGPSVAAAADAYPIKLERRYTVGQEFTVAAKGDSDQTVNVTVNGQAKPVQAQKFAAEVAGVVKVLAVNEKTGGATKVQVTVDKLTKDGADVFPAGTVITADHAGEKAAYSVNGADVDPQQAAVLELLVDVDKADKASDADAMFGTPKPQPVGGQWDADAAKMAADMQGDQLPVSAEHMKATAKLVKVEPVDGKPAETVEMTFAADPLEAGKEVGGLTITGGTLNGTVTQTMPVDPAEPATAQDVHMTVKMTGTAGGGAATADIAVERNVHRTMTAKK